MEEVQKQLAEALNRINDFENEKKAAEALARFNSRMQELDELYDLDDEDRRVLADDIKILESDEAFAAYKGKLGVMWKNKNKKAKEDKEKEMKAAIDAEVEKRISELKTSKSSHNSVDQILDKAKASNPPVPNNNQESSKPVQSLYEKFAQAFKKENIIIS
jgi:phenylalanyl-tRNA synthetase alpha subunit